MKTQNTAPALTPPQIRAKLLSALTQYDAKESAKRGYNRHALGIYIARLDEIARDIDKGATPRAAICAGFMGRLADACLRSIGLPTSKESETPRGLFYVSASEAKK